jgi:hypothetical protein
VPVSKGFGDLVRTHPLNPKIRVILPYVAAMHETVWSWFAA